MPSTESKTIRLGWIALEVVIDSSGNATAAHAVVHPEKGINPFGALLLAQVAQAAESDLRSKAVPAEESPGSGDTGSCECREETATGAAAVNVHPSARTATGDD